MFSFGGARGSAARKLKRLREEQSKPGDARSTEVLRKEYAELRAHLDDTLKQVNALRIPPRVLTMIWLRKFTTFGAL